MSMVRFLGATYFTVDVFAYGAWLDLQSTEDLDMKELAATLLSIVL